MPISASISSSTSSASGTGGTQFAPVSINTLGGGGSTWLAIAAIAGVLLLWLFRK